MKNVVKLTKFSWDDVNVPIIIGTESIIVAEEFVLKHSDGRRAVVTKIRSRGAMVETTYVLEGVEEIYELINN
jgi:hypothetical protein